MKKLQYIQPEMVATILPAEALMGKIGVAGSPTGPGLSGGSSAPMRNGGKRAVF